MNGQLIRDVLTPSRGLDRIDIAYHVGDGYIRRGQFLHIPVFGRKIANRCFLTHLCNQFAAAAADRMIWIIVDFTALDIRHEGIEQRSEHADQARLGLSSQPEQDKVMTGKYGVYDVRHHAVFEADDARKQSLTALDLAHQVGAQLVFYRTTSNFCFGKGTLSESSECVGQFPIGFGQSQPPDGDCSRGATMRNEKPFMWSSAARYFDGCWRR